MEIESNAAADDILVLRADGEINGYSVDDFIEQIEARVAAGRKRIIVDCTLIDRITSAGLSQILRLQHRVRKNGGQVRLCCVKGLVRDVINVLRLNHVFSIDRDEKASRAAFDNTPD